MNQDSLIHRPYLFKTMAKHHLAQSRQLGVGQTEVSEQLHQDQPCVINCPLSLHLVCNDSWVENGASSMQSLPQVSFFSVLLPSSLTSYDHDHITVLLLL